jgi:catechol 2,3-dioxygenase-like lactoylglutathione lyase family enzyme
MTPPRIDHIGIVVESLEPAVAMLRKLLPGAPLRRRSMPEVGLEVAEFEAANIVVELLAYTAGACFGREVMGDVPGLNHLSLEVPDLSQALAALAADGIAPSAGFPREGAHGRIAFLPPDPATRLLFELCEPHAASGGKEPAP